MTGLIDSGAIYIDARPDGYGVLCNGKAEVWAVGLEECLQKLRPLVAALRPDARLCIGRGAMPEGFPRRHISVSRRGQLSFGIRLGYTEADGGAAFGGISAIRPGTVDGVMQQLPELLEMLRLADDSQRITVESLGTQW